MVYFYRGISKLLKLFKLKINEFSLRNFSKLSDSRRKYMGQYALAFAVGVRQEGDGGD